MFWPDEEKLGREKKPREVKDHTINQLKELKIVHIISDENNIIP